MPINRMKLLWLSLFCNISRCFSIIFPQQAQNHFSCLKSLTEPWWSFNAAIISENDDLLQNFIHFPNRIYTIPHASGFFENVVEKPISYLIIPNSTLSLEAVLENLVESQAFQVSTYMILVPHNVDVHSVAAVMWNFRLPNSLIIQANSLNSSLSLYSTQIVDCGSYSIAKHILDLPGNTSCPSGMKIPQFSFKQTFLGCPLKIIWVRSQPYVYEANNSQGWKGIFINALEALGPLSGREIVFFPDDLEFYEDVARALAYDSVISAMENETELFVGSGELGLGEIFDVSTIITESYLKIIAPKPLANHWKKFSSTMSLNLLTAGCIISVLVVGLTHFFNSYGSNEDTLSRTQILLLLFSNFVGAGGFGKLSQNSSLRILFGFLVLSLMLINLFLQGSLISLLTGSMYGAPILSMAQLIESNLNVKVPAMIKSLLVLADPKNKELITILHRAETSRLIDFGYITDQLIKEKNFATFTLEALVLMRPNIKKSFSTFTYLTVHTCFGMRKNDVSSPLLYNWILNLVESGIMVKFEKLHFNELALRFSVDVETNPYTVNLRQFWPIMLLLFLGLALSTFGLLCEFLYFMFSKRWVAYKSKLNWKS